VIKEDIRKTMNGVDAPLYVAADEDGEADELSRKYILLPKRPIAHVDHLSSVPCGTCPVAAKCTPGGVISPETCIYMSHWLQW
jgi:hypothetical protein